MSWLQPRKGGLYFTLSDNNKYNFDVKVGHCGFVSFVNDVIDCGCLRCVFCFTITKKKRKKKRKKEEDIFYINFYIIIFF